MMISHIHIVDLVVELTASVGASLGCECERIRMIQKEKEECGDMLVLVYTTLRRSENDDDDFTYPYSLWTLLLNLQV